jgi:hypothetical protein
LYQETLCPYTCTLHFFAPYSILHNGQVAIYRDIILATANCILLAYQQQGKHENKPPFPDPGAGAASGLLLVSGCASAFASASAGAAGAGLATSVGVAGSGCCSRCDCFLE